MNLYTGLKRAAFGVPLILRSRPTGPAQRPWRVSPRVRKAERKRGKRVGAAQIDPKGSISDVSGEAFGYGGLLLGATANIARGLVRDH